jgi:hypothetical protein
LLAPQAPGHARRAFGVPSSVPVTEPLPSTISLNVYWGPLSPMTSVISEVTKLNSPAASMAVTVTSACAPAIPQPSMKALLFA